MTTRRPTRIPPQRPRPGVALRHRNLWSAITEYPGGMTAVRFFSYTEAVAAVDAEIAQGRRAEAFPPLVMPPLAVPR